MFNFFCVSRSLYCVPRQWNTKLGHDFPCVRPSVRPSVPYVTQPRIFQCMSHSIETSDVCHTAQFSPMYVTQPSILQCMSHTPVFGLIELFLDVVYNIALKIPLVHVSSLSPAAIFQCSWGGKQVYLQNLAYRALPLTKFIFS